MLSTQKKAQVTYDPHFDILYYNFDNSGNAYGDEDDLGIITFRDFDSDEITGYTIFNFVKACRLRNRTYEFISKLFDTNQIISEYCS